MKVEFDSGRNSMTINGVEICLEVLEAMTNPDPRRSFRYSRIGSQVIVHATTMPEGERPRQP